MTPDQFNQILEIGKIALFLLAFITSLLVGIFLTK